MQVFYNYTNIPTSIKGKLAVTIGNFDGVHLGHQALIKQLKREKRPSDSTMVILFEPQPKEFFLGEKAPKRIFSLEQKIHALKKQGIDYILVLHFSQELHSLTADNFINKILIEALKAHTILIGDDFRFGKNRKGDFQLLQAYSDEGHFKLNRYDTYYLYKQRVSSTWIRECLSQGNNFLAQALLGASSLKQL